MPLTNQEFARLDAARVNSLHLRKQGKDDKCVLQLAFEHIEDLSRQQQKAVKIIQAMINHRNKSLCWRAPAWFALQAARVRYWFKR